MILRDLSDLKFPVGADVVAAVETIKALDGRHTHDSGHQEGPACMRLQDPMAKLGPDRFRPTVWEVDVRNLRDRHE